MIVRQDHDLGSYSNPVVQIDDVGVLQPDAAAGNVFADAGRIVSAVDAICGITEIKRTRPQRIAGPAADPTRQIRLPRHHFGRRNPIGPFRLADNRFNAGPGKALPADPDPVTHCHAMAERQIKKSMRRIDDDGAGRFGGLIGHDLAAQLRRKLL